MIAELLAVVSLLGVPQTVSAQGRYLLIGDVFRLEQQRHENLDLSERIASLVVLSTSTAAIPHYAAAYGTAFTADQLTYETFHPNRVHWKI